MVDIIVNENLINHTEEYDAIIVSTNCYQVMRNGFQYEILKKYPYVIDYNYETKYADPSKLGTIVECKSKNKPLIILIFTTFGYNFKGDDKDFFDYDALEKCIKLINILYKGNSIATTMIGCEKFDGNAIKEKVLSIINKCVKDFDLTIYDYIQNSHCEIEKKEYMINLKKRYAKNKERLKNRRKNSKEG